LGLKKGFLPKCGMMHRGGTKMKKLLLGTILLALSIAVPAPATAEVGVSIGISLPPLITFAAPPEVIVIPETTDVYVIPDIDVDIFFWDGWWWRPWEGRWYRSRYYDRGWVYYRSVPRFYFDVDPGWRGYYRDRHWHGHRWDYERIPDRRLKQQWRGWRDNRHWERRRTWGVQSYQPRPRQQRQELRRQRQDLYQQRPEVQRHQQERLRQKRQPRVREPQRQQRPPQVQRPERQQPEQKRSDPRGRQREEDPRRRQSQGRPDRGGGEPR
jgi:hypothetical protein